MKRAVLFESKMQRVVQDKLGLKLARDKRKCQECKSTPAQSGCLKYCCRCFRMKCPMEYDMRRQRRSKTCQECNAAPAQSSDGKCRLKCLKLRFPWKQSALAAQQKGRWAERKAMCRSCNSTPPCSGCGAYCWKCLKVKCPVEHAALAERRRSRHAERILQRGKTKCQVCNSTPACSSCGKHCWSCFKVMFPTKHAVLVARRRARLASKERARVYGGSVFGA